MIFLLRFTTNSQLLKKEIAENILKICTEVSVLAKKEYRKLKHQTKGQRFTYIMVYSYDGL